MKKSVTEDWVHVYPGLASGKGGRVGRGWNIMYSFRDCC